MQRKKHRKHKENIRKTQSKQKNEENTKKHKENRKKTQKKEN